MSLEEDNSGQNRGKICNWNLENKFTRINTMKRMEWLILEKIIHVCVFYIHLQYIIVGNTFNNTMCSGNKSNIPFTTIANMKPKCQQRLKMIEKHMLNEYF